MPTIDTDNYTIGGIDLYYSATINDVNLDAGTTNGVGSTFRTTNRNMGNIITGEFAPDITYLEHFIISSEGDRRKDHVVTSQKTLTIPFSFDEINENNVRKYFYGTDISASAAVATPVFSVMSNTLEYGSAQVYFRTDIGNDFVYMIPKCTLRPEGNMTMDTENWWSVPMVLEVLYNTWSPPNVASAIDAPYGIISMAAI